MAQLDTGLGWSAKDTWLVQGAGKIADISAYSWLITGFESQTIPVCSLTATDVVLNGLTIYEGAYDSDDTDYRNGYVGSDTPGCIVGFTYSANAYKMVIFGPQNAHVLYNRPWHSTGNPNTIEFTLTSSITVNGNVLYYDYAQGGDIAYYNKATLYVPFFTWNSSLNAFISDAATYVTIATTPIDKTNVGYAVGATARWYTTNGTMISTPILISSVSEYVEMESDDTTLNFAKANFLYSGTRFYMGFFDAVGKSYISALPDANLTQFGASALEKVFKLIADASFSNIIVITSPDPYEEEGADSGEEGGGGEDTEDDEHGIEGGEDFPSAINTGFCRIFTPSESDLQALSSYLWSSSYDLTQVKKLFSNPMDSIIGLSAVPIRLTGSAANFSLGGVPISGLTLPLVSKQRYSYFMGSIDVKERWGSYLDYDPYTKFSIFLPFIGMRELSTDDIMGKTVGLHYDFDILSGTCVARLQAGKHCLYEWGGTCALQLPINSRNWDSVFNTAVGAVTGIVSAAASGSAPLVAGSAASAALQTVSMKPRIDKSGSINGAAGWLGQMRPYLIRTTPEAYVASDQNAYIGYPSYMSVSLGSLSGYNEIESVHLENIPATGDELAELESILKGGAIF